MLLSDTRTNAGPDNIASFTKMNVVAPGDRVIAMMSAGNLAVTQAVVARVIQDERFGGRNTAKLFFLPTRGSINRGNGSTSAEPGLSAPP